MYDDHLLGTEESTLDSIQETNEHVKEARVLRPPLEANDDYKLAESKMRRALDRLKRAAVKVIDTSSGDITPSSDIIIKAVRTLLMDIATTMEALLSVAGTVRDFAAHLIPPNATTRDPHQKITLHCLICFLFWHGQRLLQTIPFRLTRHTTSFPGPQACLVFDSLTTKSVPPRYPLPRP